jgi:hypothetical protein
MPLTAFQTDILHLLAGNRRPQSHVAGGIAINRYSNSPRYSADLDLFHDTMYDVGQSADQDAVVLTQNGYEFEWSLQQPNLRRAQVKRGDEAFKLEWCHDSAFRFFPVQPDAELGFCLHPADLATNKALALASRSEIRDFIDILFLHETYLSLGAICWAAAGKDQGYTPRSLLDFAKRHMKFREEDLSRESLAKPVSLIALKEAWLQAADQAERLFARLPLAEVGCLYLTPSFAPMTPDPSGPDFSSAIRHYGSPGGSVPRGA